MKAALPKTVSSESVGFFLTLLLVFASPLAEAPKNLLILGLFFWWLSTGNCLRDLRTAPLHVNCFLLFATLPLITLMTSDLADASDLISDVKGAVKFGVALAPLYSLSRIKSEHERATVTLMIFLVAGGLAACIDSYVAWIDSDELYMEFRGIGHVNQSALYMNLVSISGIFLILQKNQKLVLLGWIALIASLAFLFLSRSINAIVTMLCIGLVWIVVLTIEGRYKKIFGTLLLLLVVAGVFVSVSSNTIHWGLLEGEITDRVQGDNKTSSRIHILQTALEIYDRNRWFGVGPDRFGEATSEARLRAELEADGRSYDQEKHKFFHTNHGHNVWTNVLVERGLAGVIFVALFFVTSGIRIWSIAVSSMSRWTTDRQLTRLLFLSGASWTMLFVGGLANTTLHLEHGLIGVMVLVWSITILERYAGSHRN